LLILGRQIDAAALAVVEDFSGTMTNSKAPLASAWRASGKL
jgi:hypothetical protein